MNHSVSGTGKPAMTTDQPLRRLSQTKQLAPRVRAALEGLMTLSTLEWERSLTATLDEFEKQLFDLAEKARNNEIQHAYFETLRTTKQHRAEISARFVLCLEDALTHLNENAATPDSASNRQEKSPQLALVGTTELEESLVLQEIAARAEQRENQTLSALGYRFGVLAGAPAFDPDTLPLGPTGLAEAMRYAAANLDIPVEHRVLLFRTFDRLTMAKSGALFRVQNDYLIKHRILRHLRHGGPAQAKQDVETPAAATEAKPAETAPPATTGNPVTTTTSAAPERAPAAARAASAGVSSEPNLHGHSSERDQELFATLRELLSGTRHLQRNDSVDAAHSGSPGGTALGAEIVKSEVVQSALGTLQRKQPAITLLNGSPVQRSVPQLKQDLLNQLRQQSPSGRAPRLEEEVSDTIDLVGMLFDYLAKSARPNGCAQTLFTKLQVPLLRVALKDKTFFTQPSHPARELLNSIAETSLYWVDDGEDSADGTLVEKMQALVDRISGEYDGDLALFEESLGEMSQHMKTLARKAEVAERRHVDAARGREKLDLARAQASTTIAEYLTKSKPSKLVRTLLEQTWTDVLALTLLRQGEQSDIYKRRLDVAAQLLTATSDNSATNPQVPVELRQEFETGLSQIGYHNDDIQAVVRKLFLPEEAANEENPSSQTELAIKLKSQTRLGTSNESSDSSTHPDAPHKRLKPQLNAAEQAMYERVKALPFGTWFEFVTNQQGDIVRRKLCWFSTMTGRCLFVNQRGTRADERTLEQLAIEMVRGQSRIMEAQQESLIDRAWAVIVGSLKQITGRKPEVKVATG